LKRHSAMPNATTSCCAMVWLCSAQKLVPMPSPTLTARATWVETNRRKVKNTSTTASAVSVDAVSFAMRLGPRGASRSAPNTRIPVAVTAPNKDPTGE
jgi:hypothetical protein